MHKRGRIYRAAALLLVLLGALQTSPLRADMITYMVTVDTSSVSGSSGNLDFQFNPGTSSAAAATATVTNFQQVGGSLATSNQLTGSVSGVLPDTLSLSNSTAYNDIYQGVTYGSGFSFDLTLSGPAIGSSGGSSGSSFALSLYDVTGTIPLLTTDPNGSVATVNVNADGTTSVVTFAQSATNSTPVALVSVVPEPSSVLLFLSSLPAVVLIWRRGATKKSTPLNSLA